MTPKITSNSHLSGKFSEKKKKQKTRRSSSFVIPASGNGNYHSINAKFSSQFCCLLVSSQFFDLPTDDCHFELKTRFFAEMEKMLKASRYFKPKIWSKQNVSQERKFPLLLSNSQITPLSPQSFGK